MPEARATILVNDEDALDFLTSLMEMEIEEDHRLASMVRIKLCSALQNGRWSFIDDDRVKLWKKIKVSVNLGGADIVLIEGYITELKPHLGTDRADCCLEIVGMDGSSLMSVEEKIKDWPNMKDSDIATTIFKLYNLTPQVDTVDLVHEERVSTIIQRETDIRFLKRLARRNGFECFVKGGAGYFRKPVLTTPPQPVLASHFGAETNLLNFDARLNALRPTRVQMHQINTISKDVKNAVAETGLQRRLGRDAALTVAKPAGQHADGTEILSRMFVKHAVATDQPEMQNLCRALFDEAEWFLECKGEINSVMYGSVLETKKLLPIKGVGETFSGLYYVTNVKHVFGVGGYVQKFAARRNALVSSGPSDFAGPPGGIL